MKDLNICVKPASAACNMACRYCFYEDVSRRRVSPLRGMMSLADALSLIDNVYGGLKRGDRVTFMFQGGEPTLAGLPFFQGFAEYALAPGRSKRVETHLSLQTNGLLLDDAFCDFLRRCDVLVGLSLDMDAAVHDKNRLDRGGAGTYARVEVARRHLHEHGCAYNVLSVLTREMARHPQRVWAFIREKGLQYVQFIPCLGPLDGSEDFCALTPGDFASFYTGLFGAWLADLKRGRYVSVKLFDDLINLLHSGAVNACGLTGRCSAQIVVEADGSVYPCDFYCLDEYRAGNILTDRIEDILASPAVMAFLTRRVTKLPLCDGCRYSALCGGGCPRMRAHVCASPDGGACGYQRFLDACLNDMTALARSLRPI